MTSASLIGGENPAHVRRSRPRPLPRPPHPGIRLPPFKGPFYLSFFRRLRSCAGVLPNSDLAGQADESEPQAASLTALRFVYCKCHGTFPPGLAVA